MLREDTSFFFLINSLFLLFLLFFCYFTSLLIFTKIILLLLFYYIYFFMKIIFIFSCSGMFRIVPACSGMFHVPGFIDAPKPAVWQCSVKVSKIFSHTDFFPLLLLELLIFSWWSLYAEIRILTSVASHRLFTLPEPEPEPEPDGLSSWLVYTLGWNCWHCW